MTCAVYCYNCHASLATSIRRPSSVMQHTRHAAVEMCPFSLIPPGSSSTSLGMAFVTVQIHPSFERLPLPVQILVDGRSMGNSASRRYPNGNILEISLHVDFLLKALRNPCTSTSSHSFRLRAFLSATSFRMNAIYQLIPRRSMACPSLPSRIADKDSFILNESDISRRQLSLPP